MAAAPIRSSTLPKPAVVTQERVSHIASQLSRSSVLHLVGHSQEEIAHDTAAAQEQNVTMASQRGPSNASGTCPTCKRAYDEEDQPATQKEEDKKKKNKDSTVDIDAVVEDKFNQLPPLPSPLPKQHPRFVHCVPPEAPVYREFSVFLAGSIEMGKAVQWQRQMATCLSHLPITVNNPRRGHWDPTATQEAKNEAFRHQVEWELSALEKADVICFFFDANTISPVTMMELGLWAHSKKVVVCCDKRFWRAGNVHIVCQRYGVPFVEKFEDLVPAIETMLGEKGMQLDERGDIVQ